MFEENPSARPLATALSVIFFLSGASSLLFETLWFRLTGLVFGNSAWATAVVLASFMAGLAIGNVISTRLRHERPLRVYAALELTIAISGFALILVLPILPGALAPLFRSLIDSPILHAVRMMFAFVLLLAPATVMGATLPTMVSALTQRDSNFGRVLGLLYGCNTIGAVAGALAGELVLIRVFGIRGTGLVAAIVSCIAATAAWLLRGASVCGPASAGQGRPAEAGPHTEAPHRIAPRLLLAAAASGFALLALEVIWFRFVILFAMSTSLAFAVMLAVVLAGIGIGALVASAILSRFPDADDYAAAIAMASVAAVVLSYSGFVPNPARFQVRAIVTDALRLMLPVSILSGMLFTAIGRAVERATGDNMRAAAAMTFANTIGAAVGPVVAGFVLIPTIGIERSFFVIAVLYVAIAALMWKRSVATIAAGILAVATLALFPFHLFTNFFLPLATHDYRDARLVALREGPIETAVVLRSDYAGEPYAYRLYTNGYSMSATTFASKRYMSSFVFLPLALRPQARNALLISYGVGVTAKTLTEEKQLQSIDVVDISRTILGLSSTIWPGASNPLADPRVHVHVEDGRFFLLTTPRRFDLITAEPPPPKSAGIVSLYTREHFRLIRDRLTENGIASYWLPAYQLTEADNKAVIRAFCDAFEDCSLWSGAGAEWILIGSRSRPHPPSYEDFARQWRDPVTGDHLRRLGIESPEQLGASFLLDADGLRRLTSGTPPVTDDFPLRLSAQLQGQVEPMILRVMENAEGAFNRSALVRGWLPPEVLVKETRYFEAQRFLDRMLLVPFGNRPPPPALLRSVLTSTDLRTLPRLLFGSDAWLEDIALRARARGDRSPSLAYVAAVGALCDRDYPRAAQLFAEAEKGMPGDGALREYEALARDLQR